MSCARRILNSSGSSVIKNNFDGLYFATQRALFSSELSSGENKLSIPIEKLDFAYSRSSGPGTASFPWSTQKFLYQNPFFNWRCTLKAGGQNVNKLNTKAELRFHVYNADWITSDVKARLHAQQPNRINNEGELLITAQEHRYLAFDSDFTAHCFKLAPSEWLYCLTICAFRLIDNYFFMLSEHRAITEIPASRSWRKFSLKLILNQKKENSMKALATRIKQIGK